MMIMKMERRRRMVVVVVVVLMVRMRKMRRTRTRRKEGTNVLIFIGRSEYKLHYGCANRSNLVSNFDHADAPQ